MGREGWGWFRWKLGKNEDELEGDDRRMMELVNIVDDTVKVEVEVVELVDNWEDSSSDLGKFVGGSGGRTIATHGCEHELNVMGGGASVLPLFGFRTRVVTDPWPYSRAEGAERCPLG